MARLETDYLAQATYQHEVLIRTSVEKIGNSSLVLLQEAFQNSNIISRSKTFLVHFDYGIQKSAPIPQEIKEKLQRHQVEID